MRRAATGGRSWILIAHSKHNALTLHRGVDSLRLMEHGASSSCAFEHVAPIDWKLILSQLCLTD
jgi:hypothetical protein|tara:strand:+ start:29933 stop:30124 length:192 start_codon:yes stop_codon:yes gene_type:complete